MATVTRIYKPSNVIVVENVLPRIVVTLAAAVRWRRLCEMKILQWLLKHDADYDYSPALVEGERAEVRQDRIVIMCSSPAGPLHMELRKDEWDWAKGQTCRSNWTIRGKYRSSGVRRVSL